MNKGLLIRAKKAAAMLSIDRLIELQKELSLQERSHELSGGK